jgi:hypothetical protein
MECGQIIFCNRSGKNGWEPLDAAARRSADESAGRFAVVAALLRGRGAVLTATAAAALGDADWLRAFTPVIEEVRSNPLSESYLEYLRRKLVAIGAIV